MKSTVLPLRKGGDFQEGRKRTKRRRSTTHNEIADHEQENNELQSRWSTPGNHSTLYLETNKCVNPVTMGINHDEPEKLDYYDE